MKTQLTIEESARLIELGVDASLASKCQVQHESDFEVEYRIVPHDEFCYEMASLNPQPMFDLADLLSILPKEIEDNAGRHLPLAFSWDIILCQWNAHYTCATPLNICAAPELIDSLYQLAIWCLENNHIKTEKK